jgi:peptide/nickel transport system substrate-binding protein
MNQEGLYMKKLLISIFILLFFLPSCSEKKEPKKSKEIKIKKTSLKPVYGDKIITGSIGDISNLIPILATDSASHEIAGLIYNGLLKYNKNLKLTGDLAESYSISKNNKVITFKLKKGIKWQDNIELTADDVIFTYNLIMDPKTPTAYRGDYELVEKVEKINDYEIKVYYKKPFAPALSSWTVSILPQHLLKGKNIIKSPLSKNPVGTGPFKFEKWEVGQVVQLKSNKNYFKGRPYLNGYIYKIIPDPATMFLELKAGKIDVMGLTPIQYKRQTETDYFKKNFKKFCYPVFNYTYLGFNLKNPLFKDKKVRQAISFAIDKTEIVDGVLLGLGTVATGPYRPDMWYYNKNVKKYNYCPECAKKLLKETGWADSNNDGILDKNSKNFEFTILTNQGNNNRLKTAQIIQRRLKKIGIKVNIRVIEWASFINEFIDKKRFEAVILGWSTGIDPDQYDIWHSSKTGQKELNFISYKNKNVDKLLEKGRLTFNMEERKKIYFKFQEILAEDEPYVFLYVPYSLVILHKRFKNVKLAPAGIEYNLEKWWVPKIEQKY